MRKVNLLEPQKIITMIILLMSICIKVSAQSPYAMFGDNSKMLEAKRESVPSIYRVGVQSTNGVNLYADFDLSKGIATLIDKDGNVIQQDSISENAKAILKGQPHSHSNNADYIYGRQWNVMRRLGYDYLESPTGTVFR